MYRQRNLPLSMVFFSVLLAASSLAAPPVTAIRNGMCLTPWAENPFYWQYKNEPVLLLGGSVEDNLFQIDDLEAHLDLLQRSGGNYVRNTLSSRDDGNLWMFQKQEDGRYDMEQLNEAYYARLQHFLELTFDRDIVVQFELWDRFDYARTQWLGNPFRPANNVNYTVESSGLKNDYPQHPGTNQNPFFRSIPAHDNHTELLKFQHKHMDRVLEISLPYPNVLYCMDNETSATPEWGAYWSAHVKAKAKELGVVVHTTEMWDDWNLRAPQHRATLDHPEIYSFVDTSQNNHQKGQAHWDNLQWVRGYLKDAPRPINHVKAYGADGGQFGDSRDGVERFWRSLVGGAASIRFHRPTAGLGLSSRSQANIKSARMLCNSYNFSQGTPVLRAELAAYVAGLEENEVHSNRTGSAQIIYLPRGGTIQLRSDHVGPSPQVRWLDIENSVWRDPQSLDGTNPSLSTPSDGAWVALVRSN